ncbi:MAG: hypothetical protein GF401_20555 [Chitinivibrionales bacterium]|nr:hypothetical protein [Chitinivibrionales bacterium]
MTGSFSFQTLGRWCFAGILLTFYFSCTPPPPVDTETAIATCKTLFSTPNEIRSLRGSGEMIISVNGESHKIRIDVLRDSSGDFSCDFYTIFGNHLASITGDTSESIIEYNQHAFRYSDSHQIRIPGIFLNYPFTFGQFKRIITGNNIFSNVTNTLPDSVWKQRRSYFCSWKTDSVMLEGKVSHDFRKAQSLTIQSSTTDTWQLLYADYKDGIPEQIQFIADDNNYFKLKYDHLTISMHHEALVPQRQG